ncbi:MAG: WD40/YVTN/BNR-like repeat-containing protein [Gemmatimonadales bacterium]
MPLRRAGAVCAGALLAVSTAAAQQPRVTDEASGVTATLQAVSAVSPEVAWAGGSNGTVLRTIDGGDHWTRLVVPGADRLEFRGVQALSGNEAWVLSAGNGPDSRIYHTHDGGITWTGQFTNADSSAFYDCIGFFDAKHGIAFSDASQSRTTILHTDDGGTHWALLPPESVPATLPGEGAFASSNSCIAIAGDRGWIAASTPRGRILRSDDAGRTWTVAADSTPLVHGPMAGITALSFRDAHHGIAVAATINNAMPHDTSANAVATTNDGGATWQLAHRPAAPGSLSGGALVPAAGNGVAVVATYSGVFVTRDLGQSWTAAAQGLYWAVRAAGKRAWAVGRGGRITRIDF